MEPVLKFVFVAKRNRPMEARYLPNLPKARLRNMP